ncbi:hypothetical protein BO221_06095 [Archangium sp. Cb G35]|nr:hypothetical protein BO221_06095 [Archangium sp. Cb G35]
MRVLEELGFHPHCLHSVLEERLFLMDYFLMSRNRRSIDVESFVELLPPPSAFLRRSSSEHFTFCVWAARQ